MKNYKCSGITQVTQWRKEHTGPKIEVIVHLHVIPAV